MFNLLPQLPPGEFEEMKQKIVKEIQTYEVPQVDESGNLIKRSTAQQAAEKKDDANSDSDDDARMELPLPEGVLKVNLGIPVVVVCNKVDILMQQGQKYKILLENIDFI